MPIWLIILIGGNILFWILVFIWKIISEIKSDNLKEDKIKNEILNGLKKYNINENYIWKNEDVYEELQKAINNKITDFRNNGYKPKYKAQEENFMIEVYNIVFKYYKKDYGWN